MGGRTEWLSEGAEKLAFELLDGRGCDIAIVGSGYGGAVAAARLAGRQEANGKPANVWLLERGREHVAGGFPERFADLPGQTRISWGDEPRTAGLADGLFDLRLGKDVSSLLGNGLGGGSLINAGVLGRPLDSVFRPPWPAHFNCNMLDPYFAEVERMLGAQKLPPPAPAKLRAIEALGRVVEGKDAERRANIAVTFADGINPVGVPQRACVGCGDCFTGCNYGAKNTLAMNYLPLARRRGARLFTGVTVLSLQPIDGAGWELELRFTDRQIAERFGASAPRLRARRVILAAGAYGSTGILLRSWQHGFDDVSPRLGERFSTNGDMIAVGYGMPAPIDSSAQETVPPSERRIGPTIAGMIDLRLQSVPLVIEELAIPAALRRIFEEVVTTFGTLHGLARTDRSRHRHRQLGPDPAAIDAEAMKRTAVYATMGDDGAKGVLRLKDREVLQCDDDLRVEWKDVGEREVFKEAIRVLERAHAGSDAMVIPNPMWKLLPSAIDSLLEGGAGGAVFTVHPLGGCAMADRVQDGVVNHLGQVFRRIPAASPVHKTLAVLDGAIIPTALEINPCLTIAAVAEYAVEGLVREWGLSRAQATGPLPPLPRLPADVPWRQPAPTAIRLAERLGGELSLPVSTPALGTVWRKFDSRLDIAYEEIPDLESFLNGQAKVLRIPGGRLQLTGVVPRSAADGGNTTNLSVAVELAGDLRLLELEETTATQRIWRAGWAWFWNRGLREICNGLKKRLASLFGFASSPGAANSSAGGLYEYAKSLVRVASHAGEGRRLIYTFTVARDVIAGNGGQAGALLLKSGDRLEGEKRLAYVTRSIFARDSWPSPWDQLTKLPLYLVRQGAGRRVRVGLLEVDLPYFVQQYATQLQVARQENQPRAIADLYSVFGYLLRVIGKIHIFSFRAPDYPDPYPVYEFDRNAYRNAEKILGKRKADDRLDERLPGKLKGLRCEPFTLKTRQDAQTLKIRLTRYTSPSPKPRGPVLLIHGLGAGGNTFALPTVKRNLVQHLVLCGFDPWVLDLRTSIGLPTSKQGWSFEDVAFNDIPAAIQRVLRETQKPELSVVAHCIGAAMFCMAALDGKLTKGWVRAAVLCQVGPLLELPATNRFRGFAASYLKYYLDIDELDITSSLTRFNRFIDRLLAAYPYPKHEWSAHHPVLQFWKTVTHEAFCLRAYGIYGRLFEHRNMNHKTLDRLGDYLGHMQYRTYQQTIYYATMRRLTDEFGRNAFVTHENIKEHLDFPLCFLHGKENEVFHVRTSRRSFDLLASIFWWPDLKEIWRTNVAERYEYSAYANGKHLRINEIEGYGHQDCMMGKRAHKDVFPRISDFLAQDFAPNAEPVNAREASFVVRPPRMGPVVGWVREANDGNANRGLRARIVFVANDSRSKPLYAMSIVLRGGQRVPGFARFHALRNLQPEDPSAHALDVPLPDAQGCRVVIVTVHSEQYEPEPMREAGEPPVDDPFGEDLDRFPPNDLPFPPDDWAAARMDPNQVEQFVEPVLDTCKDLGIDREPLPTGPRVRDRRYSTAVSAAILDADVLAAAQQRRAQQPAVCFALASCRYAATVGDREAADSSFGRLRGLLEAQPAGSRPQLLFLAGDQVYADATYGIFDPTIGEERYDYRYLEAWTAPNAREVLRRLPVYPMLDDHEVQENFEGASSYLRTGLRAFESFQSRLTPAFAHAAQAASPNGYWYRLSAGGVGFFVADTRTGRCRGRAKESLDARILHDRQMRQLKRWLWRQHKAGPGMPKFVVSPSVVAPWSRETRGHRAHALRSDAWDGFPASLHELLGFIAKNGIRNVVFLSGDFHSSVFCRMALAYGSRPLVRAYSIVSSGLYAPYPFANTRAEELELEFDGTHRQWLDENGPRCCGRAVDLRIRYRARPMGARASFAVVTVEPAGAAWRMRTDFHAVDGAVSRQVLLV